MISRCFNTYLFRHFTPYFEHFQPIHLSFSTPISKTSQPIYLKCFIALTGEDIFLWRICNVYESFMLRNKYTHLFSNYFEHTREMTQLLHEAIINHKDLTVVWLDQDNAYGSIPHQLIQVVMHQYYIQDHVNNLFMNYFNKIHLKLYYAHLNTFV